MAASQSRPAQRQHDETRDDERRAHQDEREAARGRRARQPVGERARQQRDDQRERALAADQRADLGRRVRQLDEQHRPVGREHADREREPERRKPEHEQQRSDLRCRFALARQMKIPPLAVAVVAVSETLDERVGDAENAHALVDAAAVATSRGYVASALKRKYALPASGMSMSRRSTAGLTVLPRRRTRRRRRT